MKPVLDTSVVSAVLRRLEDGSRRRTLLAAEYRRLRALVPWMDWTEAAALEFCGSAVLGAQVKTSTGIVYPNAWNTTSWTTATDGKQLRRPALYCPARQRNGAPKRPRILSV